MNNGLLHKKIFSNIPILISKRLTLRKITVSDAKDMFEYARVPKVSKYTVWSPHKDISETLDFIRYVIRNYRSCESEDWGIIYKPDTKFIGTIGFFNWDEANRKAEIHYALSNRYSGLGIMTEAVKRTLDFGFTKMRLNRIEARCMMNNKASERVMQKCGMKYEGIMRGGLFAKGRYTDLKTYAVLKANWVRSNNI